MATLVPPVPVEVQVTELREQVTELHEMAKLQKGLVAGILEESRNGIRDARETAKELLAMKEVIAQAQGQAAEAQCQATEAIKIARTATYTSKSEAEKSTERIGTVNSRLSDMQGRTAEAAASAVNLELEKTIESMAKKIEQKMDEVLNQKLGM